MCGRYSLGVRLTYIRNRLPQQGLQVDEAPEDEQVRETYNFAPGNYGAVYRAESPDQGQPIPEEDQDQETEPEQQTQKYKLQSMRWGLIPFWTKQEPANYGAIMRTINCRDDSLIEDRGLWTQMKRRKRCLVICQGFYEWLKKGPGGKEKIPHFVKRKDGELMCFAGLWDCVSYEGSDEKLYTYTIITTSSNSYLKFLHDRMPVILDPGSEAMKTWLDSTRTTWTKELQSALKPYEGELECYPVPKEVGKVGNNSPDFIVPIKDNKNNIANFFANAKKKSEPQVKEEETKSPDNMVERKLIKDKDEQRTTQDSEWTEDNAPVPVPGIKREHPPDTAEEVKDESKKQKTTTPSPEAKRPASQTPGSSRKGTRATYNGTPSKRTSNKAVEGSKPITDFFKK